MLTEINGVETNPKSLLPIKLTLSWVIIKHHKPATQSDEEASTQKIEGSALYKPGTTKEDYSKGTVMCVGPGEPNYPIECEPTQEVMYFRNEARPIEVGKVEYDLVTSSQVIAIL